jgi:hypothetical protein
VDAEPVPLLQDGSEFRFPLLRQGNAQVAVIRLLQIDIEAVVEACIGVHTQELLRA